MIKLGDKLDTNTRFDNVEPAIQSCYPAGLGPGSRSESRLGSADPTLSVSFFIFRLAVSVCECRKLAGAQSLSNIFDQAVIAGPVLFYNSV
jgi:hypothetical protein